MFGLFRRWRRKRLRNEPFPAEWRTLIKRKVRYFHLLTDDEQDRLCEHVRIFLEEKYFEGCGGLEMTDEVRLTVAAQACLLLLNHPGGYFRGLRSVLVYPSEYRAPDTEHNPDGSVTEGVTPRLGESWDHGIIVLSWDNVAHDAEHISDGSNVVLHEFAHQLDSEDGMTDGSPIHHDARAAKQWAAVLSREYKRLVRSVRRGMPTFLDPYGAEAPAEFFAVITESFFEEPIELREAHPELYEELRRFYDQDPATRFEAGE
jgi:hypothetical protein